MDNLNSRLILEKLVPRTLLIVQIIIPLSPLIRVLLGLRVRDPLLPDYAFTIPPYNRNSSLFCSLNSLSE